MKVADDLFEIRMTAIAFNPLEDDILPRFLGSERVVFKTMLLEECITVHCVISQWPEDAGPPVESMVHGPAEHALDCSERLFQRIPIDRLEVESEQWLGVA